MSFHRILIVDDEPDVRFVARMALEHGGNVKVTECSSGREALQVAADLQPDVILLDVMMPEMDGPATFEALRASETTRGIPVIIMSAKIQPHERRRYEDMGVDGVIPKPFDPMALLDEVRAFLAPGG